MATGPDPARRIVLDTSAYSWLRTGHPEVLDHVARADVVWLPTIVLGELEAGFRMGTREEANQALLADFLSEPFVSILPVDRGVARRYGRIFSLLKEAGSPIPLNDVWIAATTFESGGALLTFDRHFGSVAGLDLIPLAA